MLKPLLPLLFALVAAAAIAQENGAPDADTPAQAAAAEAAEIERKMDERFLHLERRIYDQNELGLRRLEHVEERIDSSQRHVDRILLIFALSMLVIFIFIGSNLKSQQRMSTERVNRAAQGAENLMQDIQRELARPEMEHLRISQILRRLMRQLRDQNTKGPSPAYLNEVRDAGNDPYLPVSLHFIARVLVAEHDGNWNIAAQMLEQLREMDTKDPDVLLHLSHVHKNIASRAGDRKARARHERLSYQYYAQFTATMQAEGAPTTPVIAPPSVASPPPAIPEAPPPKPAAPPPPPARPAAPPPVTPPPATPQTAPAATPPPATPAAPPPAKPAAQPPATTAPPPATPPPATPAAAPTPAPAAASPAPTTPTPTAATPPATPATPPTAATPPPAKPATPPAAAPAPTPAAATPPAKPAPAPTPPATKPAAATPPAPAKSTLPATPAAKQPKFTNVIAKVKNIKPANLKSTLSTIGKSVARTSADGAGIAVNGVAGLKKIFGDKDGGPLPFLPVPSTSEVPAQGNERALSMWREIRQGDLRMLKATEAKSLRERVRIIDSAITCYTQAQAHSTNETLYHNWGLALVAKALHVPEKKRAPFYNAAVDKFLAGNVVAPHYFDFHLASLYAIIGDAPECHKWLQTAREHGGLDTESLLQAPDFDNVRHEPWFDSFLES